MAKKNHSDERTEELKNAKSADAKDHERRREDGDMRDATTAEHAEEKATEERETRENEKENSTKNEGNNPDNNPDSLTELQELQKKYDTLNDKFLRSYSEFENFRRRTAREKIEMAKSASGELMKDLLPVLDDFDRAIAANQDIEDIDTVKEGFELIYNKLFSTLKNKGLKPMDSLHQPFDTDHHEAITNIPAPEEDLKGKVVDVAEKGYMLNDRVLRYAKVVVGQ